jgi:hypothetical protein
MKNMVVSVVMLLATVTAYGQSETVIVCNSVSRIELSLDRNTLTTTVNGGEPLKSIVQSSVKVDKKRMAKVVGEPVLEAYQYVTTAPQGGVGNPQVRDVFTLVKGASENIYEVFPNIGVVATALDCQK